MMRTANANVLATASNLAGFHECRAVLYRTLGEMLAAPPTPRALEPLLERLQSDHTHETGVGALLETALHSVNQGAFTDWLALVSGTDTPTLVCDDAQNPDRLEAFQATGRAEEQGATTSELLVIASLADKSARALRKNDMMEASALCDLQHRFLRAHASTCLLRLAGRLSKSSSSYYQPVGLALERLVVEDLTLLDTPPAKQVPRPGSP